MAIRPLAALSLLLGAAALQAQTPTIMEAGGGSEAAWVKWTPVTGASRYNVYVTGGGLTEKKLDDPLIRSYGTYWRADIPGLKAGSYTFKVAAVVSSKEQTAASSAAQTVVSHDRSGFAFAGGVSPGAYKLDGTPKDSAVVVYVTDKTKDTVSLTVTGATTNPCKGIQAILDAYAKGKDARPLIIRIVGKVTDPSYLLGGDIVLSNKNIAASGITLEGVGPDATVYGWGIRLKNASSVEVRNIGIMLVDSDEGDNIGLQQTNDHIWIHHTDQFYGMPGSDADQFKGDGSLDCKKSTDVTFSYNHFFDNGKANLLGLSEGDTSDYHITYHHNWYDHSDSRHPRVRYYSAHVYNNYYDGNSKYGVGAAMWSSVFVEGNYFRHCKYPMLTAAQGSDIWTGTTYDHASKGTFSGEDGGTIKAWNNHIEGASRFASRGNDSFPSSTTEFDAYVVSSRTALVPNTVKAYKGGAIYNNFDMNTATMYTYVADAPDAAKAKVIAGAGRVGGDFKWTFDNAVADTFDGLDASLKAALVAYVSPTVYIQGQGTPPVSVDRRPAVATAWIRLDPNSSQLRVEGAGAVRSLEVVSLSGAVVARSATASLSLAGLGRGVYVARAVTERGVCERTLLKGE